MHYNYSKLLKSGVKIYKRRNALLHAKTAVIDDVWWTVGSTNMDYWSFLSNDEVNAVILSREFAVEMEKMLQKILRSPKTQWEEWKERRTLGRQDQRMGCAFISPMVVKQYFFDKYRETEFSPIDMKRIMTNILFLSQAFRSLVHLVVDALMFSRGRNLKK